MMHLLKPLESDNFFHVAAIGDVALPLLFFHIAGSGAVQLDLDFFFKVLVVVL